MYKKRLIIKTIAAVLCLLSAPSFAVQGKALCKEPGFFCLRVAHGETWKTLWPDPEERHIIMSINRINTPIYPGLKLAVPENLTGTNLLDFSPFPRTIDAPGEKLVIFSPALLAWGAYLPDGSLIKWGPAAGGAAWCPDIQRSCRTKPGTYRIDSTGTVDCKSTKFPIPKGGAPMPYCMFFNGGQALHGGANNLPGYNASHGCVRLMFEDSQWLSQSFIERPGAKTKGTKVIVESYEPKDDPDSIQRDRQN